MPDFFTINRKVLILKAKEPLLEWYNANKSLPAPFGKDDVQIYLIPDFLDRETAENWLKENYFDFFETALEDWHEDDNLWPDDMSWDMFQRFFDLSFQNSIADTVSEEDENDDDFDGEGGFAAEKDEMDWD